MTYLAEFRAQVSSHNFQKVMQLWQEYFAEDQADGQEICGILELFKQSEFVKLIGEQVETAIPLISQISEEKLKERALCLVFDIETTNNEKLASIALDFLKTRFGQDPQFNEKLRLVGLRNKENFQGALSNFLLLNHIKKNNFVFHTAGWGVGEIIDFSFLREQMTIEFENLRGGKKDISFSNAFKTLLPIPNTHFLALRFGNPDLFEKEAKDNPVELIKSLLRDLGPKTAAEIKDELVGFLFDEKEYSKWWQNLRGRLKKNPLIETPDSAKGQYFLREGFASEEDRITKAFYNKKKFTEILQAAHSLIRDFPEVVKNKNTKEQLVQKIKELYVLPSLNEADRLQILLFLEHSLDHAIEDTSVQNIVMKLENLPCILNSIEIVAIKKQLLLKIRKFRSDWIAVFLDILFTCEPNALKDYLLKELSISEADDRLKNRLKELIEQPKKYPEAFVWYFQKAISSEDTHFGDAKGRGLLLESFLLLFAALDAYPEKRELSKKMHAILTGNKFQNVRSLLKGTDLPFVNEFLLLTSKCRGFSEHDQKILQSLVEVVHPSLAKEKMHPGTDQSIFWTTQEGYQRTQEHIKHIGTIEIVENAREIEAARQLGDLRENAEFKSAIERRSRLQSELKRLSDQFHKARIITKDDIPQDCIGIGVKVDLENSKGEKFSYTILGAWDAKPEQAILSFQSKFVEAMLGKKVGDIFNFKGEDFTVLDIQNFLEQSVEKNSKIR